MSESSPELKRLLSELQDEVLKPEAIEYVIAEFGRQVKGALDNLSSELSEMGERKGTLEAGSRTLERHGSANRSFVFSGRSDQRRERQLREITERLLSAGRDQLSRTFPT